MDLEQQFTGLTKKRAQDLAEKLNVIFRLIRIDDKPFLPFPDPSDKRDDRVCVEIDKTFVTKVTVH